MDEYFLNVIKCAYFSPQASSYFMESTSVFPTKIRHKISLLTVSTVI